ncbi:MAG: SPOR domain-containing protein [Gemmatimonadaceae bacterium]|nr:SPOR domain-containing protein [Gemmatimonadaceae bacterium]
MTVLARTKSMSHHIAVLIALVLGATLPRTSVAQVVVTAPSVPGTRADSIAALLRRAQRLVNDGQGAEGRALVDSILEVADPLSPEEGEALYWRARLAESWEAAQRDYLRLMLEHERSPRYGETMLRLAQGESARGDREAAIRYLERLAREAPESAARAEGGLWHGRLLVERGARVEGCSVLRDSRGLVPAGQIELENQYDFLLRGCPEPGAGSAAPSVAPSAAPSVTPPTPPTVTPPVVAAPVGPTPAAAPATSGTVWSVQIAAVSSRSEAAALSQKLTAKGYAARVDGDAAPYRVRFGRYATRAAAAAAAESYKTKEKAAAFVVEVPRG